MSKHEPLLGSGRRPSHLVSAATLLALVVVVVLMLVIGYHQLAKPFPKLGGAAAAACTKAETTTKVYLRPGDVQVSVFNAGARKGFAGLTLRRLEARGFVAGTVGNAPSGMSVTRTRVYTTQADSTAAKLVARTMGANVPVIVTDQEYGAGVDVFVGTQQRGLNRHAPSQIKLPKPEKTCVRVD